MRENQLHRARIISSGAATLISLACGSNYVYSAWAPQFTERLHLSATESNIIGLAGNLGMYSLGVPIGMFVDQRGPRPAVLVGSLLLGAGYIPFHAAYDTAAGSVPLLCLFSYLTGLGGCMAFAAAVKTSALNWPHHRGTATAFPLAAFGLSAFFFSLIGSILFPADTSAFLMLLAAGTSGMALLGFFFLRVLPPSHNSYRPLPGLAGSQQLHQSLSEEAKQRGASDLQDWEPDIRGRHLLRNLNFWQLFSIMGILGGIGLMTINNIGHDANALWRNYDPTISEEYLISRQQLHVSILSLSSFAGRILSGVGSDVLVKRLKASRVWCLVIASSIFLVAQVLALGVSVPYFLVTVSALSGLGYGFLYGVFPSIVAESFGIHALSQNWGYMTLSPIVTGNAFNIFYGAIFDSHSVEGPGGELLCLEGLECYREAYLMTLAACVVGLFITLMVIRQQYLKRLREEGGKRTADD
ncbi:hypothetical protein P8C59_001499 [Phyllachora maydis]|uniref:Nodulin-like domain-containing protein n=1 Tax=Phyllachora maydis TaxID=1825666 RepID=A0AAD9HZV4_9PEZI|nr:hypothetical protein P8C59_001499 [Phyllachora maydis]